MRALAITVYYVVFLRSRSRYVLPPAGEVVSSLPAADVASFPALQPLYYTALSFLSFHSVTPSQLTD